MKKNIISVNVVKPNCEYVNAYTHGGVFHADEVMATAILANFKDINVARVFKVDDVDEKTAIVYDIGGGEFDHHQKGGNGFHEGTTIPYAACGLIWREFGNDVVRKFAENNEDGDYWFDDTIIDGIVKTIDKVLIQGIDAVDNGCAFGGSPNDPAMFTVSNMVALMNPNWDADSYSDSMFTKAVYLCSEILQNLMASELSKSKAAKYIAEFYNRSDNHIMVMDRFMPWQETLDALETAGGDNKKDIWYVIFPSNRGGFNVQCVPLTPGSFGQKAPLPEAWKGNAAATGVEGCTFIHPTGFIGACDTLEHAMALATKAAAYNRALIGMFRLGCDGPEASDKAMAIAEMTAKAYNEKTDMQEYAKAVVNTILNK